MKTQVTQFLDSNSNGLTEFNLGDEEWAAVEDLVLVLKVRIPSTTISGSFAYNLLPDSEGRYNFFFSADNASLSAIIPAMDTLDQSFATGIINERHLSEPLRHALSIGKRTMNRYYALTDDSHLYRMAMSKSLSLSFAYISNASKVLDPSYKLSYFHQLKWTEDWIDTAVAITRVAWEEFKPNEPSPCSDDGPTTNVCIIFPMLLFILIFCIGFQQAN